MNSSTGPTLKHGFVIAVVAVGLLQPLVAQSPTPVPIQRFLAANPTYRLLAIEDVRDVVDDTAQEYFTPFAVGDLTGDTIPEVAAVIVEKEPPIRFGLVVVHGPVMVHWVRKPQPEKIVSVTIEAVRRLYVKHCLECDANSFVRWNGSSYEDGLWIVGDVPATYDRQSGIRPVSLRHIPDSTGKVIANLPECSDVKILQVLPRRSTGIRWYRVEVTLNGRVAGGFLPSDVLTDVSCIG